jgi:hypothetical protein
MAGRSAAAALVAWLHAAVAWSECGSGVSYLVMEPGRQETSGHGAQSLEWRQLRQLPGVLDMTAGEPRQPSLAQ